MVSIDETGNPCTHVIDFGASTAAGHPWPLGKCINWKANVKKRPWYAAEVMRGEKVYPVADVVGFCNIILNVVRFCRKPYAMDDFVGRGLSWDMTKRPNLSKFQMKFRLEKAKRTSRFRNVRNQIRINPFWSIAVPGGDMAHWGRKNFDMRILLAELSLLRQ